MGEVPAPFNLEKHNFNPHKVIGDFKYDKNGHPLVQKNRQGKFVDRKGHLVTKRGYRIDPQNNLIDNRGIHKLKWGHMNEQKDLPVLRNYEGDTFNLEDVIGQVVKDADGEFIPKQYVNIREDLMDVKARKINKKGYLVDKLGNVIDNQGRPIFKQ